MQTIEVGAVSVRPKSKLHYAIHGLAFCGAGDGRILGPARQLVADAVEVLCRRCVGAIRRAVEVAIHVVMRRRDRMALAILNRLSDALRTPAQIAEEARMLADIEAGLKANALGVKPRTLADLRAAHLAALQRDREARNPQLPLCEAVS